MKTIDRTQWVRSQRAINPLLIDSGLGLLRVGANLFNGELNSGFRIEIKLKKLKILTLLK